MDESKEPLYQQIWASDSGKDYRHGVYERQRDGGKKPLVDNPSIDEVRAALKKHGAHKVLEVGCGWGRLLSQLGDFDAWGCDICKEWLELMSDNPKVFFLDIANPNMDHKAVGKWDVIFTRGVLHHLTDDQLAVAVRNMSALADNIVAWEIPDVCDRLKSNKFDLRSLELKDE